MANGSNKTNNTKTRASRPQFHYFYGSTATSDDVVAAPLTQSISSTSTKAGDEGERAQQQNEQDSLVGEELISTDNEGEELDGLINGGIKASDEETLNATMPPATTCHGGTRLLLLFLMIAGGVAIFLVCCRPPSSVPLPRTQTFTMPFHQVNRGDFGDPVDGFIDMDLFHPSLIAPPENPHAFVFPFPTGAFWTNLVVSSPQGSMSYPIAVYPYAYRWSNATLEVSYPARHRVADKHTIQDTFAPDLRLSTVEDVSKRHVTRFDPLSVTLSFVSTDECRWDICLVQGSPYITMQYFKSTPVIRPLSIFSEVQCPGDADENFSDLMDDTSSTGNGSSKSIGKSGFHNRRKLFGVCSIDDYNDKYTTMRGVQFIFRTPEGASWIMFASEPINLQFDKIRKTTISASTTYAGVIRLAYIPSDSSKNEKTFDSSTGLRRLIYHSSIYPVGGKVSYEFRSAIPQSTKSSFNMDDTMRHATVIFSYATSSMVSPALKTSYTQSLLMLALPHHAELFPDSVKLNNESFDLKFRCIKGDMTPVIGSTWSYEEPLSNLEFDWEFQPLGSKDDRDLILEQVQDDLERVLPTYSENVYGYGKQVARLAQLTNIADQLEPKSNHQNATTGDSVLGKATYQLTKYLEAYLSSMVSDGLLFDSKMGGLVSNNGLHDKGEDFGNGRYNDHHFHYGYILYASAVLSKIDPSFIERFGPHVDAIFHDIAHPTNGDSTNVIGDSMFFPMTRHKSWFDGHSFATGMFPFGNGKSQESSSEAVNCYYGAYLWSLVRHQEIDSDLTDFSRLLLAMEIRGAKTYWHMLPLSKRDNSTNSRTHVYPPYFEGNYMVGNVGMLDVAVNTWFGSDPLYIHMINAMPITAVTNILFQAKYVQYEYLFLMSGRSNVEMAWRGYTTAIHSIIDPQKAWNEAQDLVSYELDAALSKSQVLYFISQQPGFGNVSIHTFDDKHKSAPVEEAALSSSSSSSTFSSSASCESHPKCVKACLSGDCCPTIVGTMLDCCNG